MTKEIKHTPGPWSIAGPRQFNDDIAIKDHDGVLHIAHITKDSADFADGHFEIDESEQLANARLIAAAPDLLEALEMCVQCMNGPRIPKYMQGPVKQAHAAIAKATGGA